MKTAKTWMWVTVAMLVTGMTIGLIVTIIPGSGARKGEGPSRDPINRFLARHWADPIPPQGEPPQAFSALEASLSAQSCAQCHATQYRDWRLSLHSRTTGAGLLWQIQQMGQTQANGCLRCHAPLAEQKALMALERGWPGVPASPLPAYVPADLHRQGLVCAVCHIRGHQRFGPPPNIGSVVNNQVKPHAGFTPSVAFQDSRFCSHCHQFPADGHRLNGKLRQNTSAQWRNSAYAREGKTCQSCHMPDRRHLWYGIHDADMVRRAVTLSLTLSRQQANAVRANVIIANTGVGHHFPTYLVPKVLVTLHLLRPDGRDDREITRKTIGWGADVNLSKELYDTRIPAGASLEFSADFSVPLEPNDSVKPDNLAGENWQVELRLEVAPAEHYERVYRYMLTKTDRLDQETIRLLRQALAAAVATRYQGSRLRRIIRFNRMTRFNRMIRFNRSRCQHGPDPSQKKVAN